MLCALAHTLSVEYTFIYLIIYFVNYFQT